MRPLSEILHKITLRLTVNWCIGNGVLRRIHKILWNLLMQIQEQVEDFPQAFMRLNMLTFHRFSLSFYLVQGNGFQSGGAMEHWQVFSASMVGREEKKLNSRLSRLAKTLAF